MRYPELDPGVSRQRQERAVKQMRVGDIVEAWLDCEPDAGKTRPLPIIIVAMPDLKSSTFMAKDLFRAEPYPMNFAYQWRIVGHIDGLEEMLDTERLYKQRKAAEWPSQEVSR